MVYPEQRTPRPHTGDMTEATKLPAPTVFVECEGCAGACYPPENIRWDGHAWLCNGCFGEDGLSDTDWSEAPSPADAIRALTEGI